MHLAILKVSPTENLRCNMEFGPFELNETENELQQFYDAIGCDCVEYQTLTLDGHSYDCICDEEGRNKPFFLPSLWISGGVILAGNVIFANHDKDGCTAPLGKDDFDKIAEYLQNYNYKMLNAAMRGFHEKRLQKMFEF